jgi:FixJ family two-component response regulator
MSSTPPIYVAVVDDDENLCRSLGRLLRASGIQPIIYPSAEAFLADTKHPQFDCLLIDIQLGGMSGIELGQELTAGGAHPPFIYLTAHDDPENRGMAEDAGCAAYILKTDRGEAVLEAIRKATT